MRLPPNPEAINANNSRTRHEDLRLIRAIGLLWRNRSGQEFN